MQKYSVVTWTPILASGDPIGPILKGITYMVRPIHVKMRSSRRRLNKDLNSQGKVVQRKQVSPKVVLPRMDPLNDFSSLVLITSGSTQLFVGLKEHP